MLGTTLAVTYVVLDGAFGNNYALQMVRRCGYDLISKLAVNSALFFLYDGPYSGRGPHKKYGDKVNYAQLPAHYLKQTTTEKGICTEIYQLACRVFSDNLSDNVRMSIYLHQKVLEILNKSPIHIIKYQHCAHIIGTSVWIYCINFPKYIAVIYKSNGFRQENRRLLQNGILWILTNILKKFLAMLRHLLRECCAIEDSIRCTRWIRNL